jgi:hypothetical protein
MWAYEHSIETSAAPESIWKLWADVEKWGTWNADIEKIEIRGPFASGVEITMTPARQDPVQFTLADVAENERFTDEARIDGLVLRTAHQLERLGNQRTRISYRMEITGIAAEEIGPQIGPAITADWPETMAALVDLAQRG